MTRHYPALSGHIEGGHRAVEHATSGHAAMETNVAEETSLGSDAIYHQCKSARLHSRKDTLIMCHRTIRSEKLLLYSRLRLVRLVIVSISRILFMAPGL
jgi:hypothetical protein